jgi:hypothetical protein
MSQKINKQFLMAMACLIFYQPITSLACGGVCGGGGTDIESGFKITLMRHIAELQNLVGDAKNQLNFNPDEVAMMIEANDQFNPLCAPKDKIGVLLELGKKAFVFKNETNVVYLDCKTVSEQDWISIFQSNEIKDIAFFVHEAFRVMKKEGEDDYHFSTSIYKAMRRENDLIEPVIARLFSDKVGECRAYARSSIYSDTVFLLKRNGVKVFAKNLFVNNNGKIVPEKPDLVASRIVTGTGYPGHYPGEQDLTKKFLYHWLVANGCLENK